jgi:hypothetical protein
MTATYGERDAGDEETSTAARRRPVSASRCSSEIGAVVVRVAEAADGLARGTLVRLVEL